ncbi:hypothetical protein P691DRAFT_806752 [Macrolepiota fuliginosa MF-IS2]|uniref:Transmembrane protein n=1 Tax=Macrolepiota fuliginosa MF-IS2 TaxID=1400762 RepID=A0A9P5XPL2_9AGAR|nr:hypothetical protein P691DRAFT_806752 [Macrolepiota fuliginosa MF-IS2]
MCCRIKSSETLGHDKFDQVQSTSRFLRAPRFAAKLHPLLNFIAFLFVVSPLYSGDTRLFFVSGYSRR